MIMRDAFSNADCKLKNIAIYGSPHLLCDIVHAVTSARFCDASDIEWAMNIVRAARAFVTQPHS